MGKYNKIAVIYGSDSSEWEISCRSGEFVSSRIDGSAYDIYEIFARFGKWQLVASKNRNAMRITYPEGARPEVDKTDFSLTVHGEKICLDYAYIVQHGAPGETGELQGYLEMLGIPFSACSAATSAIAFDKYACKSFIRAQGIVKLAPDVLFRENADLEQLCKRVAETLRFPVFVKPTQGGSSFGVTRVTDAADLLPAVKFAFTEGGTVLVEQGISGRELTCAAYFDGTDVRPLPPIEIVSQNEYFDYDAKYKGYSDEICPAPLDAEQTAALHRTTAGLYRFLGCKGIVRMDYILADDGLYFLEVNTIPGMTSASLVPKMVRAAGLDITDVLTTVIEHS